MSHFSERNQLAPTKPIQVDDVDAPLFNRIWNIFYNREYATSSSFLSFRSQPGKTEQVLDALGYGYTYPDNYFDRNKNIEKLKNRLIDSDWYVIYDFVEIYVSLFPAKSERQSIEKELNVVFMEEKAGYRIVDGIIVPITNKHELGALKKAMNTKYESVNQHITKAVSLYSKRKNPDYENSIKESISAVEAMCCIITGLTGAQATLGNAIKKLKDNGVHIHGAMESAFSALYGYTSDENGIRHGGIDFKNAPAEDAKYMLISCSAFVNYLIEKWSKVNPKG